MLAPCCGWGLMWGDVKVSSLAPTTSPFGSTEGNGKGLPKKLNGGIPNIL